MQQQEQEDICVHCGVEVGSYCINPYHQDINNEEVWEYICSSCYDNLMGDI